MIRALPTRRSSPFWPLAWLPAAQPGKESGEKGLGYFAEMNKAGNFVPVIGKSGTLAQGATPIIAMWDYNALAGRDTLAGNPPVEVVVPKSGVLAGVYVQAISAFAPHPNAAKLWMEYLYSDEGQLGWLAGYCHPARFAAMAKAGKIPADLLAKLPPAAAYDAAVFPTLDEQAANKEAVTKGWDATVAPTSSNCLTEPPRHRAGAGFLLYRPDRTEDALWIVHKQSQVPVSARSRSSIPMNWIGLVPFALFAILFLILPTLKIVLGAFQTVDGAFTLDNIRGLNTDSIRSAYWVSIKLSLVTALLGCLIGFGMAAAVDAWRVAQMAPQPASDLFRCCFQLCRRAACVCVSGNARPGGTDHTVAAQFDRDRPASSWLQFACRSGG